MLYCAYGMPVPSSEHEKNIPARFRWIGPTWELGAELGRKRLAQMAFTRVHRREFLDALGPANYRLIIPPPPPFGGGGGNHRTSTGYLGGASASNCGLLTRLNRRERRPGRGTNLLSLV